MLGSHIVFFAFWRYWCKDTAKYTVYNDSQPVSLLYRDLFCLSSALPLMTGVIPKANKEQLSLVLEAGRAELETMATQCLPL